MNSKFPLPVGCWEGGFYLIAGSVEHPRTARPVSQTMSAGLSLRTIPRFAYYLFTELRDDPGAGLANGQLVGVSFAFPPSPQVNGKRTAFMTQRATGKGNKMTVVSDTNNHKWLCLSCFFFRVREGLDWPVIIIKRLFHPVSISSIHSGHSRSLGLQPQ